MSDSIQASRAIVERPLVEIIGEQEELRIWGCNEIFFTGYRVLQGLQILASNYFCPDENVKY